MSENPRVLQGCAFTLVPDLQFPVLRHGGNVIADSDAIAKYLRKVYPDKLDCFYPKDPTKCAHDERALA